MRVDVVVVGSGAAGAGAALAAVEAGAAVALVRHGYGATALSSGAVKMNVPARGAHPGLDRPAKEIVERLAAVFPLAALGRRARFLTALGRIVEADAVLPSMVRGALAGLRGKKLAVIGFDGLTEVRPEPVARAARALGVEADVLRLRFPEAAHTHDLSTPEIARLCDDLEPVETLAASLAEAAAGYDLVALPPAMGLVAWEQVAARLDAALGDRWFELVGALPSVPGMRLQQALDTRLARAGVDLIHGPVLAWAGEGGAVTALRAGVGAGTKVIAAREVVLATGGLVGRGLRPRERERVTAALTEPIFGLPVEEREGRAGLRVDAEARPVDGAGRPVFANVRAAGEVAGLSFAAGEGSLALALASGWAAGELAARAALGRAASEHEGEWHEAEREPEPEPSSRGCLSCGLCLSRCPSVRALAREAQSYPGPRAMMSGLVRFESELADLAEELSLCTLCGACSAVCPASVPVPETITRARRALGRADPAAGPQAYQALREALATPRRLFEAAPIEGPRRERAECVLFIGCSLPYYERDHAAGTIRLLEALGLDFTLVDEVCCGGPLEVIGAEGALAMARHNLAELERVGARRVVTCCPRCAETMATAEPYRALVVEHTTTLLARLLPGTHVASRLREKLAGTVVTYHDPCERARLAGEVEAARAVLAAVGVELREMPRHGTFTECCGAGGGVRAAQTKASLRMARLRVADAVATGAPVLLTECPSCLHNLYNGKKRKQALEISNLSSFLGAKLD
jgi:Fe-S oxidoreductase/anaerobic glycerol-3-phosphate dehydrogenase